MRNRCDATRYLNLDGVHKIMPYVMPKRTEAECSLTETFDVTALKAFIEEKNKEEGHNYKYFHAICTALGRTIFHRPLLNCFVAGKRYWMRKDITFSFIVKQKFQDSAEESLMVMKITPEMNLDMISKIILGDVTKLRKNQTNSIDKTMNTITKLPRCLLEVIFWGVRRMEYHGIYPKALMQGDSNYTTALLSNLGSINSGAPYHHLNNYGTNSIMVTIGTVKHQFVKNEVGETVEKDLLDMTFNIDERIADGFYFAKSLRIMKYLIENPEALEEPISQMVPVDLA